MVDEAGQAHAEGLVRFLTTAAVAVSLTTVACGGSPSGPSTAATLNVSITDSPFSGAAAVLVTFSKVEVHRADDEWTTVPFPGSTMTRTCDLKKLEGAQDVLSVGALLQGHYTQIRLVVASATLYFKNASGEGPACAPMIAPPGGQSAQLEIPSGEVKLNRQFELTGNDATTMILLDFDGDRSIKETGNGRYIMTPVIGIVSVQ